MGFDLESPFSTASFSSSIRNFSTGPEQEKRQRPSFDETGMKTVPAEKWKREMSRNVAFLIIYTVSVSTRTRYTVASYCLGLVYSRGSCIVEDKRNTV